MRSTNKLLSSNRSALISIKLEEGCQSLEDTVPDKRHDPSRKDFGRNNATMFISCEVHCKTQNAKQNEGCDLCAKQRGLYGNTQRKERRNLLNHVILLF